MLPSFACDSRVRIFDPRSAPSPHWPHVLPDAPVDPQAAWSLVPEYDGMPNGMKRLGAGTLRITDHKNGPVRLHVAAGQVRLCPERRKSESARTCHGCRFDKAYGRDSII